MGKPNGEMDPWADTIVASRFRYVQVSAFYDQKTDLPTNLLPLLPAGAFSSWVQAKQNQIYDDVLAADQVGVAALAIPGFVAAVEQVTWQPPNANGEPSLLTPSPTGNVQLVTSIQSTFATAQFWQLLLRE